MNWAVALQCLGILARPAGCLPSRVKVYFERAATGSAKTAGHVGRGISSALFGGRILVDRPSWAPTEVDLTRPSVARVYDYYLGGSHNFESDRAFAREVLRVYPQLPAISRDNRDFLRRAVLFLCARGIDQFLDLGSGIPTVGNVHEVAQAVNPAGAGGVRRSRPGRVHP